jgi:hypothetical protein
MAVHRVVAQVGDTTDKPLGKRWIAVITNLLGWHFPIDQLGLLAPEAVAISEGVLVEFGVTAHGVSPVLVFELNS